MNMNDITYEAIKPGVNVYMKTTKNRRKLVGVIKQVMGGWAYFPTGQTPGDTFPSIMKVKESLEAE